MRLTSEPYGVLIHNRTAMLSRAHFEFGDHYGNPPEGIECFDSMHARRMNTMMDETASLFEPYEVVELLDDEAIVITAGASLRPLSRTLGSRMEPSDLACRLARWRRTSTR